MTAIVTLTLTDLFDAAELDAAIEEGYVRRQVHPTLPYAILNYSEKAAYERAWTPVTRQCRGLVYDTVTGEVLARPLPKFFNTHEPEAAGLTLDEPAVVMDKADGSLAVVYPTPDGPAIATRGSFASEQAIHATELLRSRYGDWRPPDGLTVLAEIVYPANRIVVDYGDLDDLILLGAVDIASGRTSGADAVPDWPGPVVETFPYETLAEALAAPVRDNREGFVVWFPERDVRTKVKYEAYVQLHRIVTGLNARTVWQHLVDGRPLAELVEPLPDEFHEWVHRIAAHIHTAADVERVRLEQEHVRIVASLPDGWTRKDFALVAASHPDKWALFLLLDGRDIRPKLLYNGKPDPYLTPSGRTYTEDNA